MIIIFRVWTHAERRMKKRLSGKRSFTRGTRTDPRAAATDREIRKMCINSYTKGR